MPRNVTVTFSDGSTHVYQNAPDDVTPEQITARASQDFGKQVTALDGGRGQAPPQMPEQPAAPADGIPNPAAPVWNPQTGQQDSTDNYQPIELDAQGNPISIDVVDEAPWPQQPDNTANGPMQELGAVGGAMFRGLAALPDMALDARDALFPNLQTDRSRFSDIPDMLGTKRLNSPGVEFAANVLGGMVVPGPKAAPRPVSAPTNALAQAGAKAEQPAANALANPRAIVEAGKREGVRVMTSDVNPPRTVAGQAARRFGEIIPFAGTAGPRAAQQAERIDAVHKLAQEYGAGASLNEAGEAVAKDFAATRGAAIKSLKMSKESVLNSIPGTAPATNTLKAIDAKIAELEARGSPTALEVVADLKALRPSFEGKTLSQLEAMRADELGAYFKGDAKAKIKDVGEKAMQSIYGPLNEDMGAFIKAKAGEQQFIKWKNANKRLSAMAQDLETASFRGALNKTETTPEAAAKLIFSKTPSEVRRLYRNLSPEGRSKAQSAIIAKVAEDAATDGVISPDKFKNGIEALDNATGIFFSPADKARIDGLTRLLHATKRGAEASVNPATGVQNTPFIAGLSLSQIFGSAALPIAGGYGVMARLYESAPVRDALLKVGRSKPGSPQEKIATAGAEKIIARYLAKSAPVVSDRIERAVTTSPAPRAAAEDQNK